MEKIKRILLSFAIVLGVIVSSYFFLVPLIADQIALKLSPKQEQDWGQLIFKSMESDLKINKEKSLSLQIFFDEMNLDAKDFKIYLATDDVINAFALMGGVIVIYEPLLDIIESPEELAGLLAHEYAHIKERHSTRLTMRVLSSSMLFALLLNDYNGASSAILQNIDNLRTFHYSREFETEADNIAIEILTKRGISPEALASLFEKIKEASPLEIPKWFSTHPQIDQRIEAIRKEVDSDKMLLKTNNLNKLFENIKK